MTSRQVLPSLSALCFILLAAVSVCSASLCEDLSCWPSAAAVANFSSHLSASSSVVVPLEESYSRSSLVMSVQKTRSPGLIVYATESADVVKSVKFANANNLRVVARSSGHDYQGRSTANGVVLIDVSLGCSVDVQKQSGTSYSLKINMGCAWRDAYKAVEPHNLVVVGGHDPTVCPNGLISGGGHSIFSRMYGTASDNVLSFTVVTASGEVVTASASENSDLFFALSGGGGNSFAIIVEITLQAHPAPSALTRLMVAWPFVEQNYGEQVLVRFLHNASFWNAASRKISGYSLIQSNEPSTTGSIGVQLLFQGTEKEAKADPDMQAFSTFLQGVQFINEWVQYPTLYNFAILNADQSNWKRSALMNVWVPRAQNVADTLTKEVVGWMEYAVKNNKPVGFFDNLVFGGKVFDNRDLSTSSVSSQFRNAIGELGISTSWFDPSKDVVMEETITNSFVPFLKISNGTYLNEWTEYEKTNNTVIPDWKTRFFGDNYAKLLQVKKKYDPCNKIYVYKGVGWDEPKYTC